MPSKTNTLTPSTFLTINSMADLIQRAIEHESADYTRDQMMLAFTMSYGTEIQAWQNEYPIESMAFHSACGWLRQGLTKQDITQTRKYGEITVRDLRRALEEQGEDLLRRRQAALGVQA